MRARLESAISLVPILGLRRLPNFILSEECKKVVLSRRDNVNEHRKLHERYLSYPHLSLFPASINWDLHIGYLDANFLLKD